jgi:hypothetical protein
MSQTKSNDQTNDQKKEILSIDAFYEIQKRKRNIVAELFDHPFLMQDALIKKAYYRLKDWNKSGLKWFENRISHLKLIHTMISS